MPVGASSPTRLQCAYVSDKEVEAVVAAVSKNCTPQYKEDVIERLNAEEVYNPEGDDPGDNDELLPKAIELVIEMCIRDSSNCFNALNRLVDKALNVEFFLRIFNFFKHGFCAGVARSEHGTAVLVRQN